jgi:D-methionine transport system ATP-binding protein
MNAHSPCQDAVPVNAPLPIEATTALKPVIRLEGVSKVFQPQGGAAPVTALNGVSLSVEAGGIVGIIGRSGAGKSTLVRLINGLERPTRGRVVVDDVDIAELSEAEARLARRKIGMVFQHFNLLSSRTAADNVALPLEIAGINRATIARRVDDLLNLVGLSPARDRYPSELSGGQKQRVGIARALAATPSLLLCDEATSALDPETSAQILDLLARIRREMKLTIIVISHEMNVVKTIADRVAVLDHGHIVEEGPTFDIFAHPQHPTTQRFVGAVTGTILPDELRATIKPARTLDAKAVIRVTFSGPKAKEPILSRLAQVLDVDVNILAGRVETIAGQPYGTLVIGIPGDEVTREAATSALTRIGLKWELLGYVA